MDIAYPKLWVPFEVLKAQELNDEFGAVAAVVNGHIEDSNIAVGAQIRGFKIADFPNGIDTRQLNDHSVTKIKLATDALDGSIGSTQIIDGSITTVDIGDFQITTQKLALRATLAGVVGPRTGARADQPIPAGETVLDSITYTPTRGYVRLWGSVLGTAVTAELSRNILVHARLRVAGSGTEIAHGQAQLSVAFRTDSQMGAFPTFTIPLIGVLITSVSPATAQTFQLTMEVAGQEGAQTFITGVWTSMFLEELA